MNPLEPAHRRLQERKAALGMPDCEAVVAGSGEQPFVNEEGDAMLAGTNLTRPDLMAAWAAIGRALLPAIDAIGLPLDQAFQMAWLEGLLLGIEYGKGLDR